MQTGSRPQSQSANYAIRSIPTDAASAPARHLKTDPEGFSQAEANNTCRNHAEELRAEVEHQWRTGKGAPSADQPM